MDISIVGLTMAYITYNICVSEYKFQWSLLDWLACCVTVAKIKVQSPMNQEVCKISAHFFSCLVSYSLLTGCHTEKDR